MEFKYIGLLNRSLCYAPCRSDTDDRRPTRLRSDPVGPPLASLGTPGTVLHNLSWDTGDLLTPLSFLLYLLIFPMPHSDYLPCVFLMFLLIYFCSSFSSSINSSTIVGSTQTKNLVVFQFRLRATLSCFPYDSTDNFPSSCSSDSAVCYRPIALHQNPLATSGPYQKSRHKGIGSVSPNSVRDSVICARDITVYNRLDTGYWPIAIEYKPIEIECMLIRVYTCFYCWLFVNKI